MSSSGHCLGWRCWYDDGSVYDSRRDRWGDLPDDGLLIKMLYYEGGGKQVQQADWYLEAPHPRGVIRRTCHHNEKPEVEGRYPGAVFKRGYWTVDEWYAEVRDEAMDSVWEEAARAD